MLRSLPAPARLAALVLLAAAPLAAQAAVEAPEACEHCGMNRVRFARSRMLVRHADGREAGTCSLRCALVELDAHPGAGPAALKVGDYGTEGHPLLDARTAVWVVGGDQRGVMTPVPKWAFATRAAADAFVAAHGGRVVAFAEAEAAARAERAARR